MYFTTSRLSGPLRVASLAHTSFVPGLNAMPRYDVVLLVVRASSLPAVASIITTLVPFSTAASVAPSFSAKSAGRPAIATPVFHGRTS